MKISIVSLNDALLKIPKSLLKESGLGDEVTLQAKKGEIKIVPTQISKKVTKDTLVLSEKALAVDWERPEEDKAWESLR